MTDTAAAAARAARAAALSALSAAAAAHIAVDTESRRAGNHSTSRAADRAWAACTAAADLYWTLWRNHRIEADRVSAAAE